MDSRKFRWGIMGVAEIAFRAVIKGIQGSKTGELIGIASRNIEKAKAAAEKCGIPRAYGSYEDLLSDPEIDAVYIPLPNHLHKEWTIRAVEAGKHVLCEKPFALSADEAREMAEAGVRSGVQIAEAFMYRHHLRYDRIKEMVKSGQIGTIRGIHGTFTYNGAANEYNVRFVSAWGGGSIYDIGCYPISAARYILEQEPEAVTVHAFFSPDHDHVDMMASGLVEFPEGVSLTFDSGVWAANRNTLEILGTDGRIEVPSAFVTHSKVNSNINPNFYVIRKGEIYEEPATDVDQYSLQVDDFARSVWGDIPQRFPAEIDAVKNMVVIDACIKSARERQRVEIKNY